MKKPESELTGSVILGEALNLVSFILYVTALGFQN